MSVCHTMFCQYKLNTQIFDRFTLLSVKRVDNHLHDGLTKSNVKTCRHIIHIVFIAVGICQ